jgi:hypothetical protein
VGKLHKLPIDFKEQIGRYSHIYDLYPPVGGWGCGRDRASP